MKPQSSTRRATRIGITIAFVLVALPLLAAPASASLPGSYRWVAAYSGDANYSSSDSGTDFIVWRRTDGSAAIDGYVVLDGTRFEAVAGTARASLGDTDRDGTRGLTGLAFDARSSTGTFQIQIAISDLNNAPTDVDQPGEYLVTVTTHSDSRHEPGGVFTFTVKVSNP